MTYNIGVDIDHVLLDSSEPDFLRFMVKTKRWHFDHDIFARTHNFNQATGRSTAETNAAFAEYLRTNPPSRNLRPIPGAHAALGILSQYYRIHLITGRTPGVDAFTRYELETHFPGLGLSNSVTSGHLQQKHNPISQLAARFHIEDSPNEIAYLLKWCGRRKVAAPMRFNIIQFPRINGQPVPKFDDHRVLRPACCDHAHRVTTPQGWQELYEQAWQQVLSLIANRIS